MKPNRPQNLPVKLDLTNLIKELREAAFELGRLDGHKDLPNPSLLIAPLTTKEATVSSKIEGTRSTVADVFLYESEKESKYSDTIEVANYKAATLWAMRVLKDRKLNLSFIQELHSMLLTGARGEAKKGKFREEQVFIGKEGTTIEQATYIPPEPIFIRDCMENLENYILNDNEDALIKAAIIHYQFEAIHPFSDGNGRIGRLIIPLYFYQIGLLYQPILYLSGYFERNRDQYIDILHKVDETKKYEEWVKFFLISVKEQAKETQLIIDKIRMLFTKTQEKTDIVKSPYIAKVLNFIFKKPVFNTKELSLEIKANRITALRLIKRLIGLGILEVVPKKKGIYIFRDLIKIL